ncbi:MAG: four helix bundle protein [Thermodesulfobacteriota bacterium]|nr:four helix bundle protein [Thermodesulfobacteriota bacterium]
MKDFKTLKVWEKAHNLTLEVYRVVLTFPRNEMYGLTSQIKRSCVSISANIAEGCGRKSDAELARFLQISMGSASELEYHLLLSRDIGFLVSDDYQRLNDGVIEIKRMLSAFIKKLTAER